VSGAEPLSFIAAREGLRLSSLLVSFQRFRRPAGDRVLAPPTSLGALPVGKDQQSPAFLLALADDEGFWIGILDSQNPLEIEAVLADGSTCFVARADGGTAVIPGIPEPNQSYRVLARSSASALRVRASRELATVELVTPLEYSRRSGSPAPEPLEPSAGYGGWRLP
jgi:hypothetical protein